MKTVPGKKFARHPGEEGQTNSEGDIEPVYLFLHMPKCAGTTFRVHIENNLAQDEILPLYIDKDKRYRDRDYVRNFVSTLPEEKKKKLI